MVVSGVESRLVPWYSWCTPGAVGSWVQYYSRSLVPEERAEYALSDLLMMHSEGEWLMGSEGPCQAGEMCW